MHSHSPSTLAPLIVHFARQALSDSDTTRQAVERIETACAFRSLSVEQERNYGGVTPKLRCRRQAGQAGCISHKERRARAKQHVKQWRPSKLQVHFARRASSGSETMVGCNRNSLWHNFASLAKHSTKQLANITNTQTPFDTCWSLMI